MQIPDVTLLNQDGEAVALRKLMAGRIVAIQTIFTSCGTICPPMGASFGKLQQRLGDALGDDVVLLSFSVDPAVDTPERLKQWAARFSTRDDGWVLLTGPTDEVKKALVALSVFTAEKESHSPMVVVGDIQADRWKRVNGLSTPENVESVIREFLAAPAENLRRTPAPTSSSTGAATKAGAGDTDNPARNYFTDVMLVDHHGREHRLYSDLLQGKVVVMNSFFATCEGVCPVMHNVLTSMQTELAEHMGKRLFFLSITVDPETDTPKRLAEYAARFNAGAGWLFLTGTPDNTRLALAKLGYAVKDKQAHSNIFIVGNEPTGLWKKVLSLGKPDEVLAAVKSVLDDTGV